MISIISTPEIKIDPMFFNILPGLRSSINSLDDLEIIVPLAIKIDSLFNLGDHHVRQYISRSILPSLKHLPHLKKHFPDMVPKLIEFALTASLTQDRVGNIYYKDYIFEFGIPTVSNLIQSEDDLMEIIRILNDLEMNIVVLSGYMNNTRKFVFEKVFPELRQILTSKDDLIRVSGILRKLNDLPEEKAIRIIESLASLGHLIHSIEGLERIINTMSNMIDNYDKKLNIYAIVLHGLPAIRKTIHTIEDLENIPQFFLDLQKKAEPHYGGDILYALFNVRKIVNDSNLQLLVNDLVQMRRENLLGPVHNGLHILIDYINTREQFLRFVDDLVASDAIFDPNAIREVFPNLKKIFPANEFINYWSVWIELIKTVSVKEQNKRINKQTAELIIDKLLPILKGKGWISSPESFQKIGKLIIDLINFSGSDANIVIEETIGMIDTGVIQNEEQLEDFIDVYAEIVANAANNSQAVLKGLALFKDQIHTAASLKEFGLYLAEMFAASGNNAEYIHTGIQSLKSLIKESNDLKEIGSVLVDIVNNSGENQSFIIQGIGELNSEINNKTDLNRVGNILNEVANIFHITSYQLTSSLIPIISEFIHIEMDFGTIKNVLQKIAESFVNYAIAEETQIKILKTIHNNRTIRQFFKQKDDSNITNFTEYVGVVSYISQQILTRQPQSTNYDLPDEDDKLAILQFLFSKVYDPAKLRAIL